MSNKEPISKACGVYSSISELLSVMEKAPKDKKCSFTVRTYMMILHELMNSLNNLGNAVQEKPDLETVENIRSSIENLSTSVQADDAEDLLF